MLIAQQETCFNRLMLIAKIKFGMRIENRANQTLKHIKMELTLLYDLLKLKAEKLMKSGDIAAYLRTLNRMNEIKVSLAAA